MPPLVPVLRNPDTINSVLATNTGKKFLKWLMKKREKIKFCHCDIVLELLFTVFFSVMLQLQSYLEEKTLTSQTFHN
jgi:hypothetical protein